MARQTAAQVATDRAAAAFSDVEAVTAAIRERGGRVTTARRGVLAALFAAEGPTSAPDIADGLGGRVTGVNLSSVYRNLGQLEELGVVRRVHAGAGPVLYVLQDGSQREYVVCETCGHVETVDPTRLDRVRAEIRNALGYQTHFTDFALIGLCPRCAGTDADSANGSGAVTGPRQSPRM